MFGWMTRARPVRLRPAPRARPRVEALESRDCPDALALTLSFQELANNQVRLAGHVTDNNPNPGTIQVTFDGKAAGKVTAAGGDFSYTTQAGGLGAITATAQDTPGNTGQTAVNFTSAAPAVTDLAYVWRPGRHVLVSGTVTDEAPGGRTVTLGGAARGTAVADGSGRFSVDLVADAVGRVTADAADQWGQAAPQASLALTNAAPLVQNFVGTLNGNTWTFTGRVADEVLPGTVVTFSGPGSLNGQTAAVNADGTFTFTWTVADGQHGTVTATAADMWGLNSTPAGWEI